ncbi:hypothetical protein ACQP06_25915 [Nocardia sp. CA-136227]|uniref:hypothetical protein n=1 Tax=Nocardia sp. CA-136227 TaxID=3239979 RepID=UPI003D9900C2
MLYPWSYFLEHGESDFSLRKNDQTGSGRSTRCGQGFGWVDPDGYAVAWRIRTVGGGYSYFHPLLGRMRQLGTKWLEGNLIGSRYRELLDMGPELTR